MVVLVFPILVIVAVVLAIIVYTQTKSWKKTGYYFEILLAIAVFILSSQFDWTGTEMRYVGISIILLGIGLLINGIVSLLKK